MSQSYTFKTIKAFGRERESSVLKFSKTLQSRDMLNALSKSFFFFKEKFLVEISISILECEIHISLSDAFVSSSEEFSFFSVCNDINVAYIF